MQPATGPNQIDRCGLEHMSMLAFTNDINKTLVLGASLGIFLTFLRKGKAKRVLVRCSFLVSATPCEKFVGAAGKAQ